MPKSRLSRKAFRRWAVVTAVAVVVLATIFWPRKPRPSSLSEAALLVRRDYPLSVIVPPSGGNHLGEVVQAWLEGERVRLRPLKCFQVQKTQKEPSLGTLEIAYGDDRSLQLELTGQSPGGAAPRVGWTWTRGNSILVRLDRLTMETGVGVPDQVACDFTDGQEIDVVTTQVTAGAVAVTSGMAASQEATGVLSRLVKGAQGWKAVDSTRIAGEEIAVFAGLTRVRVQLSAASYDLGSNPLDHGPLVLGTGATRVSVLGFSTAEKALTVAVKNDSGLVPDFRGGCPLGQPVRLSVGSTCLFPLGTNASVLLWWELAQAPYRRVILKEQLLRTSVVDRPGSAEVPKTPGPR